MQILYENQLLKQVEEELNLNLFQANLFLNQAVDLIFLVANHWI